MISPTQSNIQIQENINKLSLSLQNSKIREDSIDYNESIINPITSPFRVNSSGNINNNKNNNLYGTGNSICIGSNFYIISAAGQQIKDKDKNKDNKENKDNNYNNNNNEEDDNLNNLNKEMIISIGSSKEQIKVIKLFVIESINIGISYSIHMVPFITNFINEIGRVKIKQIESTSTLYKEGEKIRKNGVGSGFTQGIIIKNLTHLFITTPDFSRNGDSGSLVINSDNFVIGVLLSNNQNHTVIAKLDLFNFLFQ